MGRYLKKKRIYELVKSLAGDTINIPEYKSFVYRKWNGAEWLEFNRSFKITCLWEGRWIKIEHIERDEELRERIVIDIYTDPYCGVYRVHYKNGEYISK